MTTQQQMITSDDVTNALRMLISLTGVHRTDEDDYIWDVADNRQVTVKAGGEEKPLQLYREQITDPSAMVVNPFFEGLVINPAQDWFERQLFGTFCSVLLATLRGLISAAVEQKTMDKPPKRPLKITKLISPIVEAVDAKLVDELNQVIATLNPKTVFSVWYDKKVRTSKFDSIFFKEDTSALDVVSIRKKSITTLKTLMATLFGLEDGDLSKYEVVAGRDSNIPRLESLLRCYYNLYAVLNPVVSEFKQQMVVDLDAMSKHLANLGEYHLIAKWQKTPVIPASASTAQAQAAAPTTSSGVPLATGSATPWGQAAHPTQAQMVTTPSGVPVPLGMMPQPSAQSGQYYPGNQGMIPMGMVPQGNMMPMGMMPVNNMMPGMNMNMGMGMMPMGGMMPVNNMMPMYGNVPPPSASLVGAVAPGGIIPENVQLPSPSFAPNPNTPWGQAAPWGR